jgi:hypothetical protein
LPAERVQEAVGCLPARLESTLAGDGLKRWTIRDFSKAYSSGETTPVQVSSSFALLLTAGVRLTQ